MCKNNLKLKKLKTKVNSLRLCIVLTLCAMTRKSQLYNIIGLPLPPQSFFFNSHSQFPISI